MNPFLRAIFAAAGGLISGMCGAAEQQAFDVRLGAPLNLAEFGGPNMELVLLRAGSSHIEYYTVDYDRLVERSTVPSRLVRFFPDHVQIIYRSGRTLVPAVTNRSASKDDGYRLDGTLQKVVPLIADREKRFSVFWHDTLATRQNHLRLLIVTEAAPDDEKTAP